MPDSSVLQTKRFEQTSLKTHVNEMRTEKKDSARRHTVMYERQFATIEMEAERNERKKCDRKKFIVNSMRKKKSAALFI